MMLKKIMGFILKNGTPAIFNLDTPLIFSKSNSNITLRPYITFKQAHFKQNLNAKSGNSTPMAKATEKSPLKSKLHTLIILPIAIAIYAIFFVRSLYQPKPHPFLTTSTRIK